MMYDKKKIVEFTIQETESDREGERKWKSVKMKNFLN